MLAGYAFWAFTTGQLGSRSRPPLAIAAHLRVRDGRSASAIELARLPAAAQLAAAGEARRVARAAADDAGVDAARVRHAAAEPDRRSSRRRRSRCSAPWCRSTAFIIAGIVVVAAGALRRPIAGRASVSRRARRRRTRRRGMLRGLSPKRLALTNSVIAALIAGGVGILARRSPSSTRARCRCRSSRRWPRRCSPGCRRRRSRAPGRLRDRDVTRSSATRRGSRGSRPPAARRCRASPTCWRSCSWCWRCSRAAPSFPAAAVDRTRPSRGAAPAHLARDRVPLAPDRRDRAGRPARSTSARPSQHDHRHRAGAVAGRDHRLRGPDLGRAAEPGRRHGVRDLAPRARPRRPVPDRAARRASRRPSCSGC